MSKTSQRKKSLFDQGYSDAVTWQGIRWKRHKHLDSYLAGYYAAKKPPKVTRRHELWMLLIGISVGVIFSVGLFNR